MFSMFPSLFPHGYLSVLDSPSPKPNKPLSPTLSKKTITNIATSVFFANIVHIVFFVVSAFIAFVAFKEYLFNIVFLWALFSFVTFFSGGLLATFKDVKDYGFSLMVFSFSLPIFILFTAFVDFLF